MLDSSLRYVELCKCQLSFYSLISELLLFLQESSTLQVLPLWGRAGTSTMNLKNSPSFDTTCQLCSSTFTDPTTRDAVVFKTYTYERNFSDLRETASSGCLLCKLLLVRHLRYNPGLGDAPNSHDISFDIHTANRRVSLDHPNQFTSDSLPLLVISGIRTDREDEVKHDRWTQKQYSWFLNFEILAEEGIR